MEVNPGYEILDLAFDRDSGVLFGTFYDEFAFEGGLLWFNTTTATGTLFHLFWAEVGDLAISFSETLDPVDPVDPPGPTATEPVRFAVGQCSLYRPQRRRHVPEVSLHHQGLTLLTDRRSR